MIREAGIGAMTDSQGGARIVRVPPGSWMVTWRMSGAFGDSARVKFVAGQAETLKALVKFEDETRNPYDVRH